MQLTLVFFAALREHIKVDRLTLTVPASVKTVADLRHWLIAQGAPYDTGFALLKHWFAAVDQCHASPATALHDRAEVAFFPTVSGG